MSGSRENLIGENSSNKSKENTENEIQIAKKIPQKNKINDDDLNQAESSPFVEEERKDERTHVESKETSRISNREKSNSSVQQYLGTLSKADPKQPNAQSEAGNKPTESDEINIKMTNVVDVTSCAVSTGIEAGPPNTVLSNTGTETPAVVFTNAGSVPSVAVITTAPKPSGPPNPKAKLVRRKSLNPRVMAPPGVEVLDNKPMLAIRQLMDMDIHGGCGAPNTYKIWDDSNEQLFFAIEESGCLWRWACGPARRFSMDVFNAQDDQVLNFHRTGCRCDCCCCLDCLMCLQKLYVVDCLGRTLGAVKQKFSVFNVKFDIVDHDNNVLFKVLGPCCPCRCSTEMYFKVFNKTGERQIGRIAKKWGGDRTDNINVDHEYFDVTFPPKLDAVDKALILGAAFLVNIMYLEMS